MTLDYALGAEGSFAVPGGDVAFIFEKSEFVTDPTFGVQVPTSIEGVPSELLIPANTWDDRDAYAASYRKLAASFIENFKKYTHMSAEVVAAGPKA